VYGALPGAIVGVAPKVNAVVPSLVTVTDTTLVFGFTTMPKAIALGLKSTCVAVPDNSSSNEELLGSPVKEAITFPVIGPRVLPDENVTLKPQA
jgi:hypothetical protein